jgi:hypothetical protein
MKDFDEGIAVAYAGVDSGHFVCLTMVMRVINSTSESEVMTPMTRSDENW